MKYRFQSGGTVGEVVLERRGNEYLARIGEHEYTLAVLGSTPGELNLLWDGKPLRLYWAESDGVTWIGLHGCTFRLEKPSASVRPSGGGAGAEDFVRAPMPAQVRAVLVAAGESVERGQALLLLEAMKMEIRIAAPRSGMVRQVLAANDQTVQKDQVLIEIGD